MFKTAQKSVRFINMVYIKQSLQFGLIIFLLGLCTRLLLPFYLYFFTYGLKH